MKKYFPLVSIIVNCHNGEKFLKECIQSIIDQTYKNWEIIFWDNRSSDNSYKIVSGFKDRRIKKFQSDTFHKLYKSRNLAIKKCKGEYISFLDTDDKWIKDKLSKQVKTIKKDNKIKIVYSNYFFLFNKKNQKNKKLKRYFKKLPSGFITQELLNSYDIGILTTLIDRKLFSEYQFNASYNVIGDFDYFINSSLKYKIKAIQKPLAIYRVHDDNFSSKKIDVYIIELANWLKDNSKKKLFKNYSFQAIKILLLKLKIKFYIKRYFKLKLGV